MTDAEVVWMMLFFVASACAIYLRFIAIRRLNKKLDKFTDEAIAALRPKSAQPALETRDPEVERLRERLHVLERIVTDGSPTLSREIESLRR